jgi:hypothetical protein
MTEQKQETNWTFASKAKAEPLIRPARDDLQPAQWEQEAVKVVCSQVDRCSLLQIKILNLYFQFFSL